MKRSRFDEEQIIAISKNQAAAPRPDASNALACAGEPQRLSGAGHCLYCSSANAAGVSQPKAEYCRFGL